MPRPMQHCPMCRIFLKDHLTRPITKQDVLYGIVSEYKFMEHLDTLITTILRAVNGLNDWSLGSIRGEVEMRCSLIRKPETVQEMNKVIYQSLLEHGPSFRQNAEQTALVAIQNNLIRLRRTDKEQERLEEFLSNLYGPLVELLYQIHHEHCHEQSHYVFKTKYKVIRPFCEDEIDLYA